MACKLEYTRAELLFQDCTCVLCKAVLPVAVAGPLVHKPDCPLADASVTSLFVVKSRPDIMFRFYNNRWWWTSPAGKKYRIEKLSGRYAMQDEAGNEIIARRHLFSIRHFLATNQGAY